jgi:cobalt-precorrin-5B (C1)-methyltransferase
MTLRHGFTTGTAAAAAAKAAALHLREGRAPDAVDVPLPMGGRMTVAVLETRPEKDGVLAAVVKDGGDDPDATHGAVIRAFVRPVGGPGIVLHGGQGVGLVTRPGLPVAVGEAAINPAPREQIRQAVAEAGLHGADVEIRVDRGEEIARKTFNPRLGIVGGISILGTRGTVKPFSNAAYQATIRQCLDVMAACGVERPCLTTGGRSERFLRQARPDTPETACVQVADFFFYSMREAGRRGGGARGGGAASPPCSGACSSASWSSRPRGTATPMPAARTWTSPSWPAGAPSAGFLTTCAPTWREATRPCRRCRPSRPCRRRRRSTPC